MAVIVSLSNDEVADALHSVLKKVGWRLRPKGDLAPAGGPPGPPCQSDEWWATLTSDLEESPPDSLLIFVKVALHLHGTFMGNSRPRRTADHPYGLPRHLLSQDEIKDLAAENYAITKAAGAAHAAAGSGSSVSLVLSAPGGGQGLLLHPALAGLVTSDFTFNAGRHAHTHFVMCSSWKGGLRPEGTPGRYALDIAKAITQRGRRRPVRPPPRGERTTSG